MPFEIHPGLRADTFDLGRTDLCRLLLMNDANYPWFILVPEREGLTELYQLAAPDRQRLMEESCRLAEAMAVAFRADKMNVAALGNVVPQLHVHHIARYHGDPAWPGPIWGKVPRRAYTDTERDALWARLAPLLSGLLR